MMADELQLGGLTLSSRLLMGSAGFADMATMQQALRAGSAGMVTVAMRRLPHGDGNEQHKIWQDYAILPNTAGCETSQEAVLTAQLAREALGTDRIKLEVIGDKESLLPDPEGLLQAARQLVSEGFVVLPYCSDDPMLCRHLESLGCAAVMPLAAPIGTGLGVRNPHNIRLIRAAVACPVIVDAGIGAPSDACLAMELGCDGVLVNSAVARAKDPIGMARAMKNAVIAGREAFLAGIMPSSTEPRSMSSLNDMMGNDMTGSS